MLLLWLAAMGPIEVCVLLDFVEDKGALTGNILPLFSNALPTQHDLLSL
jgi:hypothetical protein